jgi:hypothetical protein
LYCRSAADLLLCCAALPPPLIQNVAIRKVKVLKAPKFDLTKLMDVHGDYTEEVRPVWRAGWWWWRW